MNQAKNSLHGRITILTEHAELEKSVYMVDAKGA